MIRLVWRGKRPVENQHFSISTEGSELPSQWSGTRASHWASLSRGSGSQYHRTESARGRTASAWRRALLRNNTGGMDDHTTVW